METVPEEPRSSTSSTVLIVFALILVVGAGMYFLGRRSHQSAQSPAGAAAQNAANGTGANPSTGGAMTSDGARHLAPHDTFYLLQYVSAKTPTGVVGFEPGQEVHLIEVHQPTQTLVVGDGTAQIEVGPDKLTNDMDIAAMVRQKDEANQTKIAAYIQKEQKAYDDAKRDAAIKTEQALGKIDQKQQQTNAAIAANNPSNNQPQGTPPVGSGDTKLDEPPVAVGGTSGYGYSGSAYYGSPYSYFSGATTGVAAPANTGAARGGNSAGTGTGGRR